MMRLRKRGEDDDRPTGGEAANEPDAGELDRLQHAGSRLLDAADEAIQRALSGDSRRFLDATRQQGGE